MAAIIRLATADDAEQVAAIYAPIVRDTVISFELAPPDAAEMRDRISTTLERYPWLVCEAAGEIAGYVYAGTYRTRAAYQWSVDTAVYTHARYRRAGVGRALYSALLTVLPLQGFYNAYAGIALPNPASVGLHESLGFQPVGVYRQVGYKMGRWHDVGWWQFALQPHSDPVSEPLPLPAVSGTAAFTAQLTEASAQLESRNRAESAGVEQAQSACAPSPRPLRQRSLWKHRRRNR